MSESQPFVTYLELRESTPEGEAGAGLSHKSSGLVLLHVLELAAQGEPHGAVTFVHDAGEHGGRYLGLARALATRGWSVALPDLRGHGRSEGEIGHSAGLREVLRDLGDVQDHLAYRQPEAPKVLIGQGLGALYGLAYACERPEDIAALVLAAPLLAPQFDPPENTRGLLGLSRKSRPTTPGRVGWNVEDLTASPEARRERAEDPLVRDVITVRAAAEAASTASRCESRIADLAMPTLLVQGSADRIARPERVRSLAGPRFDLRLFEGMRHDLFHDSGAEDVVQTVVSWLDAKVPR